MRIATTLETDRLIIRPWTLSEEDRAAWHELNSDEQVMQFFPFRRNRQQADEVLEKFIANTNTVGYGWAAACLKDTGEPIGFTGLSRVNFEAEFTPATEIGWRYVRRHWKMGYASEAAFALVAHGFNDLHLEKVVSFAAEYNIASTAVMKRIGMRAVPRLDFDMPGIGEENAHLKRHVYFELTRQDWQAKK